MSAYLVRIQDTNELVGIFWAGSMKELFWCIDEACNPYECEIKKLDPSGIFWDFTIKTKVPMGLDDFACDKGFFEHLIDEAGNPIAGENLFDGFLSGKQWRKMKDCLR